MVRETELIKSDIGAYLDRYQKKELLRFVTIGSVDDGKSTLIGRLLNDTDSVYIDQLEGAKKIDDGEEKVDLALITDGLKAEREQGITIDVAYRYFSTEKRKFIIADTPGHEQYTRNMATGASTAQVALILIDARLGVLAQSKRHAYIASLLGIPHLLVCVNKMDLKNYSEDVYSDIVKEFSEFSASMGFDGVTFVPVSALEGDNVVSFSEKTPWYEGPTVLSFLENVPIKKNVNEDEFAFPVQYVLRPHLNYRGYAGTVISGVVKPGDEILVLPSLKKSKIKTIDVYEGQLEEAFSPQSVVITLEDEIDISRGDMLVHAHHSLHAVKDFEAMIVWMNDEPLMKNRQYYLKHTTNMITGVVSQVDHIVDVHTLQKVEADELKLNDIGKVHLKLNRPIIADSYRNNRQGGAFILIDRLTNATVAAGMISGLKNVQNEFSLEKVIGVERGSICSQKPAVLVLIADNSDSIQDLMIGIERKLFELTHQAVAFNHDRMNEFLGDEHSSNLNQIIAYTKFALRLGQIVILPFHKSQNTELLDQLKDFSILKIGIDSSHPDSLMTLSSDKDQVFSEIDKVIDLLTTKEILL